MTDKSFYDRIDKACSLFTSREAVARYCHDIRMLGDTFETTCAEEAVDWGLGPLNWRPNWKLPFSSFNQYST